MPKIMRMYRMEVLWQTRHHPDSSFMTDVPFLATSDRQAVQDALTHVDAVSESMAQVAAFVRVSTISVGEIGAHGVSDLIEAPCDVVLYEYYITTGCGEFNIIDSVPKNQTTNASV